MRIQVKDFMSAPVTTATAQDTVTDIRAKMKKQGIHAIPVVEYGAELPHKKVTIRGIVTDTDLIDTLAERAEIGHIMTSKVHVIHQDSSAQAAAKMMMKHKVHHLVVMDDGKIIGMVSALDFVNLVAEHKLD